MVRKINKQRYLLAFFIAAGIFVIGLLVGIVLNEAKFSQINDVEQGLSDISKYCNSKSKSLVLRSCSTSLI
jgi:H+/Cl- antiporter ClcA